MVPQNHQNISTKNIKACQQKKQVSLESPHEITLVTSTINHKIQPLFFKATEHELERGSHPVESLPHWGPDVLSSSTPSKFTKDLMERLRCRNLRLFDAVDQRKIMKNLKDLVDLDGFSEFHPRKTWDVWESGASPCCWICWSGDTTH